MSALHHVDTSVTCGSTLLGVNDVAEKIEPCIRTFSLAHILFEGKTRLAY
jgi:hypothetical protein